MCYLLIESNRGKFRYREPAQGEGYSEFFLCNQGYERAERTYWISEVLKFFILCNRLC